MVFAYSAPARYAMATSAGSRGSPASWELRHALELDEDEPEHTMYCELPDRWLVIRAWGDAPTIDVSWEKW